MTRDKIRQLTKSQKHTLLLMGCNPWKYEGQSVNQFFAYTDKGQSPPKTWSDEFCDLLLHFSCIEITLNMFVEDYYRQDGSWQGWWNIIGEGGRTRKWLIELMQRIGCANPIDKVDKLIWEVRIDRRWRKAKKR